MKKLKSSSAHIFSQQAGLMYALPNGVEAVSKNELAVSNWYLF